MVTVTTGVQRDCQNCDSWSFDYWGKGTMVTVSTAIATVPQVFPLIPCSTESGATLTFACLATGFSPASLTFSWTKSGTALTDFIQFPAVQEGNTYTGISHIRVKRNDWDNKGNIKCLASNTVGSSQAALVIPEVKYISPTLKLGSSTDDENEVTFSCVAKDFSPKGYNLTWQKNTEQITGQIDQIETVSKGRTGNDTTLYSAASFLTVDSSDWVEGTTYTCLFDGNWGKNAIVVKKTVTYKESEIVCGGCSEADVEINIEGPRIENMSINRKGTLTCEVKVNKGKVEKMFWENSSGNEIADSQIVFGKEKQGTLFHFLDITYDEWSNGTQVACVVYHNNIMEPVKKEYKKSIGEQTKKPAVFMLPPLEHNNKVTLTCFVKDFFPQEVSVSWLVNDEDTGSAYEFKTTSPVESKGAYFVYSHLTLNVAQWSDIDVVYGCVVYHESLLTNTSKSIVRSIGSRTFEKNNVVNFSMNVPNTCNTQ